MKVPSTRYGLLNLDQVILYRAGEQDAETVFQSLLEIIDTGEISLCVLDSLGAMVSAQAYEKEIGERTYAGISQALTVFSKKVAPICSKTGCIFLGINQIRADLNSPYGGTIVTGGKAWQHSCSTRLSFRKGNYIDDKGAALSRACENPAGNIVNVALEKSKVCPPDRKVGFYSLMYLDGIDHVSDAIEVGIKENLISAAGAWYTLVNAEGEPLYDAKTGDILKFQGKAKLKQYFLDNPDFYDNFSKKLIEIIK